MDDHEHNRELAKVRAEIARIKAETKREEKLLKKETALRDAILKEIAEMQKKKWHVWCDTGLIPVGLNYAWILDLQIEYRQLFYANCSAVFYCDNICLCAVYFKYPTGHLGERVAAGANLVALSRVYHYCQLCDVRVMSVYIWLPVLSLSSMLLGVRRVS